MGIKGSFFTTMDINAVKGPDFRAMGVKGVVSHMSRVAMVCVSCDWRGGYVLCHGYQGAVFSLSWVSGVCNFNVTSIWLGVVRPWLSEWTASMWWVSVVHVSCHGCQYFIH